MGQVAQVGRVATTIHTNELGQTQVVYHSTPVVTFNHKVIILNTGGWMTATTKARMNQASNQFGLGYQVFQRNFDWFVDYKGKTKPFNDRLLELTR